MKYFVVLAAAILVLFPPMVWGDEPTAIVTKSGTYLIVTDANGIPTFVRLRVLSVDGEIPVIPTNPTNPSDPPTTPTEIPEGTYGLTKLAYDAAMELPTADRAKAKELAKVFSATSKATHQETVKETLGLMTLVLGGNKGEWPAWWELVADGLEKLERDGKFRNASETRAAWSAIADGLGRVK
jgi:hypothetical protein